RYHVTRLAASPLISDRARHLSRGSDQAFRIASQKCRILRVGGGAPSDGSFSIRVVSGGSADGPLIGRQFLHGWGCLSGGGQEPTRKWRERTQFGGGRKLLWIIMLKHQKSLIQARERTQIEANEEMGSACCIGSGQWVCVADLS